MKSLLGLNTYMPIISQKCCNSTFKLSDTGKNILDQSKSFFKSKNYVGESEELCYRLQHGTFHPAAISDWSHSIHLLDLVLVFGSFRRHDKEGGGTLTVPQVKHFVATCSFHDTIYHRRQITGSNLVETAICNMYFA